MIAFAKRNLKVFFRDRAAVFFSLLAVFIIIGLYALFLGDVWIQSFEKEMPGVRFLMDSWIVSGLLAISSITTTMGAFGIMVEDRTKKIMKDFIASPLKKSSLLAGYTLSSFTIGVIMSLITLVISEIYILANGGQLLSIATAFKVLFYILLVTLANTSIVLFLVSFFNSNNAFSVASTIIGTLIGFLTGVYLPIGQLPQAVQWIVKLFPVSHGASLFRQAMMQAPLEITFAGAPETVIVQFKTFMGVTFHFGDTLFTPFLNILALLATTILFFLLGLFNLSRKKR